MAAIRVRACAKINLMLRVLGVRPDGYHEIQTTYQTLALYDTLTFTATRGPFEVRCAHPACPLDATNLVWRAADQLWRGARRAGAPAGVRVSLQKRIPIQAGLGGGSSDAAASLRALAMLWRVELNRARLAQIAARLGADVPFFLDGGTARGAGRGDRLRLLADAHPSWVVLVLPDFGVSTKEAYAWWDADMREHHGASASDAGVGPRADASGGGAPRAQRNDLQRPVGARHREILEIVEDLRGAGAHHAAMSGSGSAVFGLFGVRRAADFAARALARSARRIIVTRTVGRARYRELVRPTRP